MHVHILGVCGTFMGGIAALAKARGHRVTGSDRNVYPPMSTQLEALGVELIEGFDPAQLEPAPDMVVVGNVMTRGIPVVERLLDLELPYMSGPQWLAENVMRGRWVLAVCGTHGKTTTSSMLAWILERAGREPGFLIGGVPANFGTTARVGADQLFVLEGDEYDTAFFDKRSKFVHLRPRTAVLGNLEFDHADIFPDVAAIQRQFHQLVRTIPQRGRILWNAADRNLASVLEMGCWTPLEGFSRTPGAGVKWSTAFDPGGDYSSFEVLEDGAVRGRVDWKLIGAHNVDNALAAIAAANHAGVAPHDAIRALRDFEGVKRRLEVRGKVGNVTVYDDFARRPTAIAATLDGLRRRIGPARMIAVFEPRSNTMKMGVHRETLARSFLAAEESWFYGPPNLGWDLAGTIGPLGARGHLAGDIDELAQQIAARAQPGDHVVVMSNGGFGGLHGKLLAALSSKEQRSKQRPKEPGRVSQ